jgi:hypothetical protein
VNYYCCGGGGVVPVSSGGIVLDESGGMVSMEESGGGGVSEGVGAGAGSVGMVDGAESAGGAVMASSFLAQPAASNSVVAVMASRAWKRMMFILQKTSDASGPPLKPCIGAMVPPQAIEINVNVSSMTAGAPPLVSIMSAIDGTPGDART